ncbi:MAG: hypothetical protein HYU66_27755, partial [Armatimonadetes bacterium]|nr:hypothetical protein [Armatimonadota bacterium]
VGDGTFGARRRGLSVPVPGADRPEVLGRGEAVSEGLMAIEAPDRGVVGLLWNPRQLWTAGKNQPHALAASPNALDHQANHLLELVVPHFSPGQPATAQRAARPLELPRGRAVFVRSELFVTADGDLAEAHRAWQERYALGGG